MRFCNSCNKEEAGKGTMAAKGLHVSSKLRHKARAIERKMLQEEKKERKMLLARDAAGGFAPADRNCKKNSF